ncbi:MAG: methylenetetrahydrofolate reductase [NAD(P)H] [Alphaproteobacteria bacterium]|nr:methylenetetrahydrofolate reductase [NAD(P)H] [Alphaproteobacteria bacterium]
MTIFPKSPNAPPNVSFEFFPPTDDAGEARLWTVLDRLAPLQPSFVSVTYGAGGSTRIRTDRVVRRIYENSGVPVAAHLTCVGASRGDVDDVARGWHDNGIRHIVALRGDAPADADHYEPHPEGYENAASLVRGLHDIGDFEISVAAYPERHPDSPTTEADLDNLKRKIDAGAARAITQYFFDASVFLRFRDQAAAAGINVPIIPGILPVTNFAKVVEFSGRCAATVPDWMAELFLGLDADPETRKMIALSTAVDQCLALEAEGVNDFHFYTLNRADLSYAICWRLGLRPQDLGA